MTIVREDSDGRREFANLLCDFMFKRLFGSEANKDVLIWFLNMVLEDVDIVDVTFSPTEHPGLTEEDRKVIFDISCTCSDGRTFIIEMQKGYQRHFRERALYYTTYPINEQGRQARELFDKEKTSGKAVGRFRWDYALKPVIVVAILNFRFDHGGQWPSERYSSSYRIREDTTGELMSDSLRFVFLELGRFRKGLHELETVFEKLIYLLKHMHELEAIPENFNEPMFTRLFLLAEIGNFTPEEYKYYLNSLKNMGDYYNIIHTAEEEAEKRGLEKGIAQGRAEGLVLGRAEGKAEGITEGLAKGKAEGITEGEQSKAREIAMRLIADGMSIDKVSDLTGIDVEILNTIT